MSNDPKFAADRLAWRFEKSGKEGLFSKPFRSFSEQVQERVRKDADVGENEVPAILCYLAETNWTLLTNERIVWRDDGPVSSVDLERVADATVEHNALLEAGDKRGLGTLTILETDGTRHRLELEPGPPFSGFWNAIKAASQGRRAI